MANSIAGYKAAYDAAKAAGNTAGMKAAHTGADSLRGYTTDATGANPILNPSTLGAVSGGLLGGMTGMGAVGSVAGAGIGNSIQNAGGSLGGNSSSSQAKFDNTLTQQPTVAGIQPTTTTQTDAATRIDQMAAAQRALQIAGLDKLKANSLSALNTEQTNLEPTYYDKRNQAAGNSDVGAMNFANYMAARGIKGNAGAMPEIYRNSALQGQIGALDQQQAQANAGIESQRALVNTNYASDVASANAGVDAQTMQAQIDQYNTDNQYKLQQAQLAMQQQQNDAQNTGYYNPYAGNTITPEIQAQLAPYANDYQAFIDANPNSPLVGYAQNARYQKVMSDQTSQDKYGQQYQTVAGMTAATQNQGQELNNKAQQIQNSALPETLKLQTKLLMQQVDAGFYSKEQALAQLNQTLAQTNATNAGVAQGWAGLANDATKISAASTSSTAAANSLTTAKSNAYKYFDSIKLTDGNPVGTVQASNLKQDFDMALSDALQQSDPLNAIIQNKQALINKFGAWGGPFVVTALENALRTYNPK